MQAPELYRKDCKAMTGKAIDTRFPRDSKESELGLKHARQYWAMMYPNEAFDIDLDRDWSDVAPRAYNSHISYDIRSAIGVEKSFWYNVSLPHYSDSKFLSDALLRYTNFLTLQKFNPDALLVSCCDIELIRRTHKLEPSFYYVELKNLGLPLDGRTELQTAELVRETKQLWCETFEDSLSKEGCMSRTNVPKANDPRSTSSFVTDPTPPFANTANTYIVTLMKIDLRNCNANSFNFSIHKKYRNLEEERVLSKNGATSAWSGRPPSGIKTFRFDSSKCTNLSVVLTKARGLSCFTHQEILDRHDFSIINDDETDLSSSKELNYNFQLMSEDNAPNAITVQMKMVRFPLKCGPLIVRLQMNPFSTCENPSVDIWNPIPLPMTNPGRSETPRRVHMATHRLMTHHNKCAYLVQVIHGQMEGMSAVLVRQENNTEVISEAHLIGPDQLPIRDQLENPERCVCLSDQRTERAFLIRDAEGDWGICVGRWAAYRKKGNGIPTLEGKLGKDNPGFLHLRFYDLRKDKMTRLYVPSRKKKAKPFCFDFTIGDVYVDMEDGHFIVSRDCQARAQNIALAFSVCMLFSLCQPFPSNFLDGDMPSIERFQSKTTNKQQNPGRATADSLPPPLFKPSERSSPRKKVYTDDDLSLLHAVGYWFYASYPVYYETELTSDFICENELCWNENDCEGVYSKGVDDGEKRTYDNDEYVYDNETMVIEEGN